MSHKSLGINTNFVFCPGHKTYDGSKIKNIVTAYVDKIELRFILEWKLNKV